MAKERERHGGVQVASSLVDCHILTDGALYNAKLLTQIDVVVLM